MGMHRFTCAKLSRQCTWSKYLVAAQRGLSLIELIVAMVIISAAIAGIMAVYMATVRGSADPLVRKQATAIAESILNEVLAQPFTFCDPQDVVNFAATLPTATSQCTGGAAGSQDVNNGTLGPTPGTETRFSSSDPFDNVADYNGYAMASGIYGLDDGTTPIAALSSYSATVTVTRTGTLFTGPSDREVLRVDVVVTGRGETITLTGYRFMHSPNSIG